MWAGYRSFGDPTGRASGFSGAISLIFRKRGTWATELVKKQGVGPSHLSMPWLFKTDEGLPTSEAKLRRENCLLTKTRRKRLTRIVPNRYPRRKAKSSIPR